MTPRFLENLWTPVQELTKPHYSSSWEVTFVYMLVRE